MQRKGDYPLQWLNQNLLLLPEKAIFWQDKSYLLVADLHLGKARHFQKHGFAVPAGESNYQTLSKLIEHFQPKKVLFLGDLFHSQYNQAIEKLDVFMQNHPAQYELILGNHDILADSHYQRLGMKIWENELLEAPFCLVHEPQDSPKGYTLAGHIHPGVLLMGKARQKLRLPCFFFGEKQAILPAFGSFTGLHTLKPKAEDQVFVVAGEEVCAIG